MTRLGQMIWDDGLEIGRKQGLEQGLEQGIMQATREAITNMQKKLTPQEIVELGYEKALVDDVISSISDKTQ